MSTNVPAVVWDEGKYTFQRKLGNFVQFFQVNLPTNTYGVPLQIVDPLTIAQNLLDCETTDDMPDHVVEAAVINVEIEEGVPIIDGLPLWERFDGEDVGYYKLFKEYREMLYVGGSRAIAKLAGTHNVSGKNLNALAKVYHWQLRCRAYDAYKKMEQARLRQFQVERLESKHSRAADVLLEQSLTYLENHPEQLNPKVAVQMLQVAMKAGRLAVGLNPDKPGSEGGGTSININQTTSAPGGMASSSVNVGGNDKPDAPDVSYLQSIMHNLDKNGALDKAKEKVIDADFTEVDE
jgi:hypothetical protein